MIVNSHVHTPRQVEVVEAELSPKGYRSDKQFKRSID